MVKPPRAGKASCRWGRFGSRKKDSASAWHVFRKGPADVRVGVRPQRVALRPDPGDALPVGSRIFRRKMPPAISLQRDLDVRPGEGQAIASEPMLLFGAQPGTREQQRDLILQVRAWLPAVLGNQIRADAVGRRARAVPGDHRAGAGPVTPDWPALPGCGPDPAACLPIGGTFALWQGTDLAVGTVTRKLFI